MSDTNIEVSSVNWAHANELKVDEHNFDILSGVGQLETNDETIIFA